MRKSEKEFVERVMVGLARADRWLEWRRDNRPDSIVSRQYGYICAWMHRPNEYGNLRELYRVPEYVQSASEASSEGIDILFNYVKDFESAGNDLEVIGSPISISSDYDHVVYRIRDGEEIVFYDKDAHILVSRDTILAFAQALRAQAEEIEEWVEPKAEQTLPDDD